MSRLKQGTLLERPTSKYLQYKTIKEIIVQDGEEVGAKIKGGEFVYWDKDMDDADAKEGKGGKLDKNVHIPLPFKFCILEPDTKCFKGYDEKRKRTVSSNEFRKAEGTTIYLKDLKTQEILLTFPADQWNPKDKTKTAYKPLAEGLGAKYHQMVYIAVMNEEDEFEIMCLDLSGGSLTGAIKMENGKPVNKDEANDGWFAFTKNNKQKLFKNWVVVSDYKAKKVGINKFTIPVYSIGEEISEEEGQQLDELNQKLEDYLLEYFKKDFTAKKEDTTEADLEAEAALAQDEDEDQSKY